MSFSLEQNLANCKMIICCCSPSAGCQQSVIKGQLKIPDNSMKQQLQAMALYLMANITKTNTCADMHCAAGILNCCS